MHSYPTRSIIAYCCISVQVHNEDWDDPRQTVGTQDEIEAIAWQHADDSRKGRRMSVNIFKIVPNPPIISGMASVTFDWKHIRHFEEIGRC